MRLSVWVERSHLWDWWWQQRLEASELRGEWHLTKPGVARCRLVREKRHILNERARESTRFILIYASKIESISRAQSSIGNKQLWVGYCLQGHLTHKNTLPPRTLQ